MRVVGPDNEVIGIVSNDEALRMAREAGVDLVEVAPNVRPPVCRLMDYGKWKYLQKKKGTKSHEQQLKEVRLRPRTDDHDIDIKIKQSHSFLEKGHKVQFTMRFRGRERAHRDLALQTLQEIATGFTDCAKVERPPMMDGRNMVMILSPVKAAFAKSAANPVRSARPPSPASPQSAQPEPLRVPAAAPRQVPGDGAVADPGVPREHGPRDGALAPSAGVVEPAREIAAASARPAIHPQTP